MTLPFEFSLSVWEVRLSSCHRLLFQLTSFSVLPPVRPFWRFLIREQLADWPIFPYDSQLEIMLPSQLAQL
jgi:hypothetical protein